MESNIKRIITTPLLFTPGPTPTPEPIRLAMSTPTLHHRTKEFESIFAYARSKLQNMLNTKEVIFLASSGTGAMEACVSTFAKTKILTISNGKFGERFGDIARAFSLGLVELQSEWDTPVTLDSIKQALHENPDIDCIAFQICESAGGLKLPYKEICALVKSYNSKIFVIADGITAIGVEKIDIEHIDALIGGSQKSFMIPPGLSFIGLSEYAIKYIESNSTGYYFDLQRELKNQRKNTTAYTPSTTIIAGLAAYFQMLESCSLTFDDVYAYTESIAHATREALKALSLQIYPKVSSNCMSVVRCDRAKEIIDMLKQDYRVIIANGQDRLKDKIFRINHMGLIPLYEITYVLNAIELCLQRLNIRNFDSTANRIFFMHFGA